MSGLVQFASVNQTASSAMIRALFGGVFMVAFVLCAAVYLHDRYHITKKLFFMTLAGIIVSVSIVMSALAVNTFASSTTGVLERRTADISLSVCGKEVGFKSSNPLSARFGGTRQYIADNRIVMQSVMADERVDASLGGLMSALGGSISAASLALPAQNITDNAQLSAFIKTSPSGQDYFELTSTAGCGDQPAILNTYVYKYSLSGGAYTQYRLTRPETYIFSVQDSEHGDCVVLEYGPPAAITAASCAGRPADYKLGGDLQ